MEPMVKFIKEYSNYGRFSTKSHKLVCARFERICNAVKQIAMAEQCFRTFFARTTVDLKDEIVELKTICNNKMSGQKHSKYNMEKKLIRKNTIQIVMLSIFKDNLVTINGEDYLDLAISNRIPFKYKDFTCMSN